ncbi:conjugal transfer protein TraH [Thiotrichales bacterium 19S11-10]|nr:conjugal transfer protein TraH [Thiotrichales bacterium 19S11-10]
MVSKVKKVSLSILLIFSLISSVFADANSDLNNFFNNLGFQSHASSPSTYKSQAAGYATFGSIYARNRVRNIQIMHLDAPGFHSGCGGIDLFAGGFSFITADQIVQFMQSILSSGAGYAFNLALEVELPEIAHAMQYMQELANKVNSQNYNSCEMAEDLVGGAWSQSRASQQQVCEDIGTHTSVFSDWAQSRQSCATGGDIDNQLDKAKNDPKYSYRVYKDTNIIWDNVIKKNGFLSSDQKLGELYMSMSGTVVFDDDGAVTPYSSRVSNSDFVKAMLYGGKVPTYQCEDASSNKCLNVNFSGDTYQTITVENSLVSQVRKQLDDIYTRLKNNQTLTDEEIGLIAITQSPVFSVVSANAQEDLGTDNLDAFAELVAADLLSDYLSEAIDIIESSMSTLQLDQGNIQNLLKSIQSTKEYVKSFSNQARLQYQSVLNVSMSVNQLVKQSLSNLSPAFKDAIKEQL